MEEAVGVGSYTGRRIGDDLAQADRRALDGQIGDETLVDIGVGDRRFFNEVGPFRRHSHVRGNRGKLQGDLQSYRETCADFDVLDGRLESLGGDRQVVSVEWNVREDEYAGSVGCR